jgi:hypothetical protein
MITTTFTEVTPEMASKWLERNAVNRTMRKSQVAAYARNMRGGEWGVSHHGIGFNERGELVDGQHRLAAIVLTGVTVRLNVTTGLTVEKALDLPVDRQLRRTLGQATGIRKAEAEICNYIARLLTSGTQTDSDIVRVYEWCGKAIEYLLDACNTSRKTKSCATLRSAVVLRMMESGNYAELAAQYRRFVLLADIDTIWQSVMAFLRQCDSSDVVSTNQPDLFARAWIAFDAARSHLKVIRVTDPSVSLDEAREFIRGAGGLVRSGN